MPWEELGTTTARVLGGLRAGNDNQSVRLGRRAAQAIEKNRQTIIAEKQMSPRVARNIGPISIIIPFPCERRAGRGTVVGAGIDTARSDPAREGFAGDRREAGKTQGGGRSHPEHRVSEGVSPRTPGASAGERLNPR